MRLRKLYWRGISTALVVGALAALTVGTALAGGGWD